MRRTRHLTLAALAITALLWLPTAQALPAGVPGGSLLTAPVATPLTTPAPGSAAVAPSPAPVAPAVAPPVAPPAPPAAPEVAPPIPGPGTAAVVLGQSGAAPAVSGSGEPVPAPPPSLDALIDAYKTGGWLAALALGISLLVYLLRLAGLLDRLPKRWRPLVPLALGCVAAILTSVAAGLSWPQALYLALLSGPAAMALHQGLIRAVCGVESPGAKAP